MRKHLLQSGSAHAILVILLVVALIGTLGFVFYQNFMTKQNATTVQETNQPVQESTKSAQLAFNSDIYELTYPASWKDETIKDENGGGTLTISNVDQTIRVRLLVSGGGIGGACDATDGLKIRYHKAYPNAVEGLDIPVYIVETMTDHEGGGYDYVIGLVPDGGERHATLGDSHCTVSYVGVASNLVLTDGIVEKPLVVVNISFPKLTAVKEMQQVKDVMATSDYGKAIKILESVHKK